MRTGHGKAWPLVITAARGLASAVVLLLAASVLIFAVVRASPADPAESQLGTATAGLSVEEIAAAEQRLRAEFGLDRPLPEQYGRWVASMAAGDWGTSYRTGQPVRQEIVQRLPASLALGTAAFAIAMLLGVGGALLASRRPGGVADHLTRMGTLGAAAIPTFLSGILLLRLFADTIDYPIVGPATAERIWLPALVMGVSSVPTLSRVLRASLIAERGRPYAVAAVARGASPARTLLRHVLRPAASPVLTLAGLALAALLTGSVITEVIFSWPGVAGYAVEAIETQDYPVVQAYVLLTTVGVIVVNRGVDVAQRLLDPRGDARAEAVA